MDQEGLNRTGGPRYDVSCSNALAPSFFSPMAPFFETPGNPRRRGQLRIGAPPRSLWPQRVFAVENLAQPDRPAPTAAAQQGAVQQQLDLARAAGGGVVYLPPGTYLGVV